MAVWLASCGSSGLRPIYLSSFSQLCSCNLLSLCDTARSFFLCLQFGTYGTRVALLHTLSGVKSSSGWRKKQTALSSPGRKGKSKSLQGERKVIFMRPANNFTPCRAAQRCYFWSSHILDACFDFLWKKPTPVSPHSGLASWGRWTPSALAYCRRMCGTCLLKLKMSTCKRTSSSTSLFLLEKIHVASIRDGEMSLFMKLGIYSKAISAAEMPWGAHYSDRSQGQAWAAARQCDRCLIEAI